MEAAPSVSVCPICRTSGEGDTCAEHTVRRVQPSAVAPLTGLVLSEDYVLLGLLGTGGMASVYRGWQRSLHREVAIKILDGEGSEEWQRIRFEREAHGASQISHPNLVTIFDYGSTSEGFVWLAMELVEGESLRAILGREGALVVERVVHIAIQLCRALSAIHAKGMVHRDLKPENIILSEHPGLRDHVKVIDFGLVSPWKGRREKEGDRPLTLVSGVLGSRGYAAPEYLAEGALHSRTDLFSLGVILYELIAGFRPYGPEHVFFRDKTPPLVVPAGMPPVPPWLNQLIMRLISFDPDHRPDSGDAVRTILEKSWAERESVHTEPQPQTGSTTEVLGWPGGRSSSKTKAASPNGSDGRGHRRTPWLWTILLASVSAFLVILLFQHSETGSSVASAPAPFEAREASSVAPTREAPTPAPTPDTPTPDTPTPDAPAPDAPAPGAPAPAAARVGAAAPESEDALSARLPASGEAPSPERAAESGPASSRQDIEVQSAVSESRGTRKKPRKKCPDGLHVSSRPSGALIFIDDKPRGRTPLRIEPVRRRSVLRLELEGYALRESDLSPTDCSVQLDLKVKDPTLRTRKVRDPTEKRP